MRIKLLFIIIIIVNLNLLSSKELQVTIHNPQDFSDIWLGMSTGGYRLLAEKGSNYSFRIFVKNGMNDRAINNFQIIEEDFPFEIINITPEKVDQIKPMEIVIFWVNTKIPEDANTQVYKFKFSSSANEFPIGVFKLESELKVVKKIKKIYYPLYTLIIISLIVILIYRKYKIKKINENFKKN